MNTKLITAEEWEDRCIAGDCSLDERALNVKAIREVQLNAAKWGMEQAAEATKEAGSYASDYPGLKLAREAIKEALDKLEIPKD